MKERNKVILFLLVIFLTVVFLGLFATRTSIRPTKKGTVLSITPSSFTAGDSIHTLTATLTDADGNPLAGKAIVWSVTLGTLSPPTEKMTNSLGQVTITYSPPLVDVETPMRIIAEFAGDELYEGSRRISEGTIVPGIPPPPPP